MISTETRKAGPFAGNGLATSFDFAFKVFSTADIRVVLTSVAGIESDLVLSTDYSVLLHDNQDTDPGGTVTYPLVGSPLATGQKLTILSNVDIVQTTDLTNGGGFYPQTIENMVDRAVIGVQQVLEQLGRALVAPVSDASTPAALPTAAVRKNQVLGFDANGNPIAVAAVANALVTSFMQTVLDDVDAAAARTTLGALGTAAAAATYAPLSGATLTDPNWTAYQVSQTWVDAGAAVGPVYNLFRDSASPAVSDALGELQFSGRDSGGNGTLYAYAYGIISSPTNGTESGTFSIGTVQAGAYADKLFVGGGVWLAGTGGDPGSGKINALEYQVSGAKLEGWRTGSIVQTVYGQNGSNASTSGTIASVTTTPASTDGASCVSASITPTNASSLVRVRVALQAFCSAAGTAWVAVFRGTTCVAAQLFYGSASDNVYPHVHLEYTDAPGTTSSTSYTVRFGTITGTGITVYVSGNNGGAVLGGKNVASIVLEELHA